MWSFLILAQAVLRIIGLVSHLQSHLNDHGKHYKLINNNTTGIIGIIDNMRNHKLEFDGRALARESRHSKRVYRQCQ